MPQPLHAPAPEVLKYLHGVSYPCDKSALEQQAKKNHAPENVIRAIEIMYDEKFSNQDDVKRNLESSEKRAATREHETEHGEKREHKEQRRA